MQSQSTSFGFKAEIGIHLSLLTKRLLQNECNSDVSVYVFCVDNKWWVKDLIIPDYITLELDDQELMTFCTGEVRAMSLLPRPYLVDFPISNPIRIRNKDLQCIISSVE